MKWSLDIARRRRLASNDVASGSQGSVVRVVMRIGNVNFVDGVLVVFACHASGNNTGMALTANVKGHVHG